MISYKMMEFVNRRLANYTNIPTLWELKKKNTISQLSAEKVTFLPIKTNIKR
jgi:hypothetical protein